MVWKKKSRLWSSYKTILLYCFKCFEIYQGAKASGILDSLAYIFTTSIPDLHLLVVFPILVEKLNMKNNAVSGTKKLRFIKDQKV